MHVSPGISQKRFFYLALRQLWQSVVTGQQLSITSY